jgi:hypothetical protein
MATPTTLPATFVSGNVLTAAQLNDLRGAFRVLQVVSTTKTDTFSAAVATGSSTAITGLSVAITPSATTSNILVLAFVPMAISIADSGPYLTLYRGATPIGVGASPGSRQAVTTAMMGNSNLGTIGSASLCFLDSPATTSATTYSVNISHSSGLTRTLSVNRSNDDTNSSPFARAVASITVLEISA